MKLSRPLFEPANTDSLYKYLVALHSKILQSSVESNIFVHLKHWIPCSSCQVFFFWVLLFFVRQKGNTVNHSSLICSHLSILETLFTSLSAFSLKQMMSAFSGAHCKAAAPFSWQYLSTILNTWVYQSKSISSVLFSVPAFLKSNISLAFFFLAATAHWI